MQIFISWSGPRSKHVAEAFRNWLGLIIQSIDPWISPDIEKGLRWNEELTGKLESAKIGIICLTKDNLNAPWLLFEAGALSKIKADHVCTFLFDLKPADIEFPLAQFQHTENKRDDIFKLICTINGLAAKTGDKQLAENVLKTSFDTFWDRLAKDLEKTPPLKEQDKKPERSESDMIREVLGTVRSMQNELQNIRANTQGALSSQGIFFQPRQRYVDVGALQYVNPLPIWSATGPTGPSPEAPPEGEGPVGPDSPVVKKTK
jgi:hypothetical protein